MSTPEEPPVKKVRTNSDEAAPVDGSQPINGVHINGFKLPPYPGIAERIGQLQQLTVTSDDVWICSYPGSGSEWLAFILKAIYSMCAKPVSKSLTLESCDQGDLITDTQQPRIISTHLPIPLYPSKGFVQNCKIVYLVRNPKDMVICYHRLLKAENRIPCGSVSDFLKQFLYDTEDAFYGSWFEHVSAWYSMGKINPNIHIMKYEDLYKNQENCLHDLCNFLNIPKKFLDMKTLLKNCSAEAWEASGVGKDNTEGVGLWKDWITVEENQVFDKIYAKKNKVKTLQFEFE